jgi:hypothetical protein
LVPGPFLKLPTGNPIAKCAQECRAPRAGPLLANPFPNLKPMIELENVALVQNEMFTFELDSDEALVDSTLER